MVISQIWRVEGTGELIRTCKFGVRVMVGCSLEERELKKNHYSVYLLTSLAESLSFVHTKLVQSIREPSGDIKYAVHSRVWSS